MRGLRHRKPRGARVANDEVTGISSAGERERGFLEAALDCVIMIDAEGRVVEFNPSAERTFGYSREEVVGRPLPELVIPPILRDQHRNAFARFVRTREKRIFGQRVEMTAMRADGAEFPIELTLSLVEGEPFLVYGAVRDLSEDKRTKRQLQLLADEQAALRHVATLVARGAGPTEVFAAVAEGVAHVMNVPGICMLRFDEHLSATKVAGWGSAPFEIGSQWSASDMSMMTYLATSGRPARFENFSEATGPFAAVLHASGVQSSVGAPILVDGAPWGAVVAYSSASQPLAEDAEDRLARFTELVATAISNVQAHDSLQELASEQGALRRVATIAARSSDPSDVFAAVCRETAELLGAKRVAVEQCVPMGEMKVIAEWYSGEERLLESPHGSPSAITVREDLRSIPEPSGASENLDRLDAQRPLSRSETVVTVDKEVWGALVAEGIGALPDKAHSTLSSFAEMVAIAVGNATTRSQLLASRARIVTAGDEARKRIQRDIHDGVQQRIVASLIDLQVAEGCFGEDPQGARARLGLALESLQTGQEELRELVAGLHPRVLTSGGLRNALESLASSGQVPVDVTAPSQRFPPHLEAAAYFVAAESLANVTKHARASAVQIRVEEDPQELHISVQDDGVGGANSDGGTGLRGLEDRIEALGGRLRVASPVNGGTVVEAHLPIASVRAP